MARIARGIQPQDRTRWRSSPFKGHVTGHESSVTSKRLDLSKSPSPAPRMLGESELWHEGQRHKGIDSLSPQPSEARVHRDSMDPHKQNKRPQTPNRNVGTHGPSSCLGVPRRILRHTRSRRLQARVDGAADLSYWRDVPGTDNTSSSESEGLVLQGGQKSDKGQRALIQHEQQACLRNEGSDHQRNGVQCSEEVQGSAPALEAIDDQHQTPVPSDAKPENEVAAKAPDLNKECHFKSLYTRVTPNQSGTPKLSWAQIAKADDRKNSFYGTLHRHPASTDLANAPILAARMSGSGASPRQIADPGPGQTQDSIQSASRSISYSDLPTSNKDFSAEQQNHNGGVAGRDSLSVETKAQSLTQQAAGNTMQLIEETVLRSVNRQPGTEKFATFLISPGEIESFLQERYSQGLDQDLAPILTITGTARDAYLTTVCRYLARTWPCHPIAMLTVMQKAISGVHRRHRIIGKQGDVIEVNLADGEVSVSGTESFIVAMAQQLGWLIASLRAITEDLAYCHASFTENIHLTRNHCSKFTITIEMSPVASSEQRSCWNSLIRQSVIVTGFPTPARYYKEVGLEIPVEIMACLGGTAVAVLFNGGYLLKGRSTMFLPVWRTPNSVQWHLVVQKEGTIDYKDAERLCPWRLSEKKLRKKDLFRTRAFLGWCTDSSNKLATHGFNYKDITFSDARKQKKRFLHLSGGSLGFAKTASIGLNFVIGVRTAPYRATESNAYQCRLQDAKSIHIILQDMRTRRAWHVDGERLILQIILHRDWYEIDGRRPEFIMLEATSMDYVRQMTIANADITLIREHYGAKKPKIEVFREVFCELCDRLQGMKAHLEDSYVAEDRQRWNSNHYVQGYEYMDVLRAKETPIKKEVQLRKSCGEWPAFARDIGAIVLFGINFGEIIQASPHYKICNAFKRVPEDNDYLAVQGSVLRTLFVESSAEEDQRRLTDGIKWHRSQHLFENCPPVHGNRNSLCGCDRIQSLLPVTSTLFRSFKPPGKLPLNCAVIFGRSEGTMSKILKTISPEISFLTRERPNSASQQDISEPPSVLKSPFPETTYSSHFVWQTKPYSQTTATNYSPLSRGVPDEKSENVPAIVLSNACEMYREYNYSASTISSKTASMDLSLQNSMSSIQTFPTTAATTPITATSSCSVSPSGSFWQSSEQQSTGLSQPSLLANQYSQQNRPRLSYSQVVANPPPSLPVNVEHAGPQYLPSSSSFTTKSSHDTLQSAIDVSSSSKMRVLKSDHAKLHESRCIQIDRAVPKNQTSISKSQPADLVEDKGTQRRVLTYSQALQKTCPPLPPAPLQPAIKQPRPQPTRTPNKVTHTTTTNRTPHSYTIAAQTHSFDPPPPRPQIHQTPAQNQTFSSTSSSSSSQRRTTVQSRTHRRTTTTASDQGPNIKRNLHHS